MNMLCFIVNTLSLSFAFDALFLSEYAMLCLVWTETSKNYYPECSITVQLDVDMKIMI